MYKTHKWVRCPDLNRKNIEPALAKYLKDFGNQVETLVKAAGKSLPRHKTRQWTARFTHKGVPDAPNIRKPDILLGADANLTWGNTLGHGELKSSNSGDCRRTAYLQLLNGAYLIFSHQDNRRFVISFAFLGKQLQLYIFDRAGVVVTAPIDIHKRPEDFVRVFTALMIFLSDVIRGRGTVCWHVRHDNRSFVIKDTWVDESRPHAEAEILSRAKDVEGVIKVHAHTVVDINGVNGTHWLRSNLPSNFTTALKRIECRIHTRLVLHPFGDPVSTFTSRKELISVLIDVVQALQDLWQDANILHRDISMNNLLLVDPNDLLLGSSAEGGTFNPHRSNEPEPAGSRQRTLALRKGLLIDLDYALVLDDKGERGKTVAKAHRTGTLPFMATQVLKQGPSLAQHQPHHDLESLFYVLIWICVHYVSPDNAERQNFDVRDTDLRLWISGESYEAIGATKLATIEDETWWPQKVLFWFAPYFEPLKPCINEWRQLVLDPNKLTHENVLGYGVFHESPKRKPRIGPNQELDLSPPRPELGVAQVEECKVPAAAHDRRALDIPHLRLRPSKIPRPVVKSAPSK
ncbi:hypothetical protein R3P38DRAFT_3322448 [Favolaschia claudopus]|uniref:Protein kinase domain-containing protein n=1 Tax=Favolaschia claudopus TaxID=2862362 RepID=A0AAW0AN42_9AGAR